jgi:transposase
MAAKVEKVTQIIFKKYDQKQVLQVPIQLEGLIPKNHLSRIVDELVESIEIKELEKYYKGGGRRSYHPKMLLKVWLYGYCERIYTSRKLAKALRENVVFIWLSGNQQPCFKTLSEFRGLKMQGMLDITFKALLSLLLELDYISLEDLYVDGSKWEANGNRHKVVWSKNTERYRARVEERIDLLLQEIKTLQEREDACYGSKDLSEVGEGVDLKVSLTSESVQGHLVRLQELVSKESDKGRAQVLDRLGRKLASECDKLEKYEQQERIAQGRKSYNRTDSDATMLRMKDERLLPAYNVQHTTDHQYVVNWTISQNASDSVTLPPHLSKMEQRMEGIVKHKPKSYTADAGYGSEENYAALEGREIEAFVKYPLWYQEVSGELKKKKFRRENWPYDPDKKCYTCPHGRQLHYKETVSKLSENGYLKQIEMFECESCAGCPFALECKKNEDDTKNRTVQHSPKLEAYKETARKRLDSEIGRKHRSARSVEVESVFGDLKYNQGHSRFLLRGIEKAYVEYGLIAAAHNIRKVYCEQSGIWKEYYAQRASRKKKKAPKRTKTSFLGAKFVVWRVLKAFSLKKIYKISKINNSYCATTKTSGDNSKWTFYTTPTRFCDYNFMRKPRFNQDTP